MLQASSKGEGGAGAKAPHVSTMGPEAEATRAAVIAILTTVRVRVHRVLDGVKATAETRQASGKTHANSASVFSALQ